MTTEKNLPEYVKENDDGSATITLHRGVTIDGTKVQALTMREPTVNDNLIMEATQGNAATKEITLIANLCGVSKDDIKKLTTRDYGRVQDAFVVFKD